MKKKDYPQEYRDMLLKRLQPPENKSVSEIAQEEGIPKSTIYTWVSRARANGALIPNSDPSNDKRWRAADKVRIVIETYSLNEEELGEYCRKHGLYASDIKRWVSTLESSLENGRSAKEVELELKTNKKKIDTLEKELNYKEKALAEAAALLVLRKNAEAIWGDHVEE
jgi:transposase